ncbi:hypothetical protein L7F22_033682 [Adiantum nelumboides]|nr:hypothetical protein [Adiantum nelumboides]
MKKDICVKVGCNERMSKVAKTWAHKGHVQKKYEVKEEYTDNHVVDKHSKDGHMFDGEMEDHGMFCDVEMHEVITCSFQGMSNEVQSDKETTTGAHEGVNDHREELDHEVLPYQQDVDKDHPDKDQQYINKDQKVEVDYDNLLLENKDGDKDPIIEDPKVDTGGNKVLKEEDPKVDTGVNKERLEEFLLANDEVHKAHFLGDKDPPIGVDVNEHTPVPTTEDLSQVPSGFAVQIYYGMEDKDVQAWVVMFDDLLLELDIYDDEENADFMYQSLGGDALQFYDILPKHVQYSWQLMKVVFLKHYVELEVPTMQSRCFNGTDEECIKSWVARVEEEMMHLNIVGDGAKADFASQGLSYDAFVFMHMLPDDWHHSWLALKFSLLMRYWRLPKPTDPIESSLVATFESLQDEFWEMLQSPFDVNAYHDDNVCCLSDLHTERGLQMVNDASVKLFDGDDVSESGYCSDFESDDYSVSLFFANESVDGTPCDGAFADGESYCDDPATFNPFRYMGEIKTKCSDQAHSANERDQVLDSFDRQEGACNENDPIAIECRAFDSDGDACQLIGSLPLAVDADDCEQSNDASDTYAKYNVVFVDDQLLSHDEEAFDQGSGQPASMHRDLDIHNVGSSQTPSVDTFTDDEADWGFDLPVVEMDADMTSYVEKASERLQILKSQRETDQACNHGMVNTLFFSEVEGAGSNKKDFNGQQILDVSGSGVLPSEVDSSAEFGHVCADMVSWYEADSESKQNGQSNGSMSVPTLEAKVIVMSHVVNWAAD